MAAPVLHVIETTPPTNLTPYMNARIIDGRVHLTSESHDEGDYVVAFSQAADTITRLKIENEALRSIVRSAKRNGGEIDQRELLVEASFWIEGALNCPNWNWDADQHLAASFTLASIKEVINEVS